MDKTELRTIALSKKHSKRERVASSHMDGFVADVVSLTLGERKALVKGCQNGNGIDEDKLYNAILIAALRVPDTDDPLFTAGDVEAIDQMDALAADELTKVALRLNGLDGKAQERAEKNSQPIPS
jgi:hypothetical protein